MLELECLHRVGNLIISLIRFSAVVIGGNGDPQEVISHPYLDRHISLSAPPGGASDPQPACRQSSLCGKDQAREHISASRVLDVSGVDSCTSSSM